MSKLNIVSYILTLTESRDYSICNLYQDLILIVLECQGVFNSNYAVELRNED